MALTDSALPPSIAGTIAATVDEVSGKLLIALAAVEEIRPAELTLAGEPTPVSEKQVRAILRSRRHRAKFFSEHLFADPAWDILLDLYAAYLGQRRLSVSAVCGSAGVPATTALRWVSNLTNENLIVRSADPLDRRRVYLALSEKGLASMQAYFEAEVRATSV